MALKPGGRMCKVVEQVVDDLPSGMVLNFAAREDGSSTLTIAGIASLGRALVFVFDADGAHRATVNVLLDEVFPPWAKRDGETPYKRDSS
jgi:hypothetical protein